MFGTTGRDTERSNGGEIEIELTITLRKLYTDRFKKTIGKHIMIVQENILYQRIEKRYLLKKFMTQTETSRKSMIATVQCALDWLEMTTAKVKAWKIC